MTLPGDLTTCVLTGTFADPAGNPMRGTVTIYPNATLSDATGNVIIPQLQRAYQLFNGSFETSPLAATDNADISPSGWGYVVQVALQGVPSYSFTVLLPTSGSPVDLSALSPATSIPQSASYLSMAGGTVTGKLTLTGSVPLQIPSGAAAGDVLTSDSSGNASWQTVASEITAGTGITKTGSTIALTTPVALSSGGTGSATRNFAGLLTQTAVKTSAYTAAAGDMVCVDTTSGAVTVTLPGAPADLTVVGVKMTASAATPSAVTIACSGSDVINKTGGGTTLTLTLVEQSAILQYQHSTGIWLKQTGDLALSQLDSRYSRKPAASEVTYFVSAASGASDSNDGLSWGSAKATIAGALTALGSPAGTIQLGAGTFTIASADGNGNGVTLTAAGSRLLGAGRNLTTITISGTVTWGIAALAAQCTVADLTLSITGTVTYGAGVSTPNLTSGSAESCLFERVYVTASGTLANAFAVGADTSGAAIDIAETIFSACEARTASTGAGFLLGNGTAGNILNTMLYGCHASHSAYGVKALGTGFRWTGGNTGENTVSDFYGTTAPNDVVLIAGVRSENSAALWTEPSGATTNCAVSLRDIVWEGGAIASTGVFLNHTCGGTLRLDSIQIRATGTVTPVAVLNAGSSGYLSVVAENLSSSAPFSQLFSFTPSQHVTVTVLGYTQTSATGSDPAVATTPGPVRLAGSKQAMTYNGTLRDTAYPVETQTLASSGAVTISGWALVADILLQASATSSSVTSGNLYPGQVITIAWRQDSTGGRTYSWPSNAVFTGGVTPTASTAAGAVDAVTFYYDGTSLIQAQGNNIPAISSIAVSYQSYTSTGSYTWTKPANAQTVDVILGGAGGGGGSGGVETTTAAGGGGGGGGGVVTRSFLASDLASSVTGTVGTGGSGGSAVSGTSATGGSAGSTGTSTTFGNYLIAVTGNVGGAGSTTGGTAGSGSAGNGAASAGGAGGGAAIGTGSSSAAGGTGGAGGGGATSGTAYNGGSSSYSLSGTSANTGSAGVAGGASPGAGTQPTVKGTASCGGGGGAGSNSAGGSAQAGASAYYCGGGGGGGGAYYPGSGGSVTSGAGGNGGQGFALVITHFA